MAGPYSKKPIEMMGQDISPSARPIKTAFRHAIMEIAKAPRSLGIEMRKYFEGDTRWHTLLQIANMASCVPSAYAAHLDHNPIRQINAATGILMPIVMAYLTKKRVHPQTPPPGKTPLQKWANTIRHPLKHNAYVQFCAVVPLQAANSLFAFYNGFNGRTAQIPQGVFGAVATTMGARAIWRNAVDLEDKQRAKTAGIPVPAKQTPKSLAGKAVRLFDDKIVSNLNVGWYLTAIIIGSQIKESLDVMHKDPHKGLWMLGSSALTGALVAGSWAWFVKLQDELNNRPYLLTRTAQSLRQMIIAAPLGLGMAFGSVDLAPEQTLAARYRPAFVRGHHPRPDQYRDLEQSPARRESHYHMSAMGPRAKLA